MSRTRLTADQKRLFRRVLSLTRPYKWRLVLALVSGMLFGGSLGGLLLVAKSGLSEAFGGKATALREAANEWAQRAYSGEMNHANLALAALLGLMLVAVMLRGLTFFASKYLIEWIAQRTIMDLRNSLFGKIMRLPLLYFTGTRTGELMSRTLNDTQLIERSVTEVICDLVQQPFVLLFAAAALLVSDWKLAAVSLLVFPVCIWPVMVFGKRVRRHSKAGQERIADLSSLQQETIGGAAIVKAFGAEERERRRFEGLNAEFFRRQIKIVASKATVNPLMELFSAVAACLIFVYAKKTGLELADIVMFLVAMVAMYDPAKKLSRVHLIIQQSSAAAERIFAILDTPATVADLPGACPLEGRVREISFENVSFSYDPGAAPVLRDVSLRAHSGELVALVGGSGAGKTTLVNLLPRFFDPSAGRVALDGTDIRDFTLESLRRHIGLVTQETFLFNDTVAANIAYGEPGAPMERIVAAAKAAHAHDFIMAMPEGYDTVIAERGTLLSGGQRQRLAIARALLRDPDILILDEATSALDTESERAVQAALEDAMVGRTVFAIAHRLSTIQRADQILVFDKGKIVDRGRHEELLARPGIYRHLHELQFGG